MTAHPDNNLRIAITGSLVVHAVLFLLLAWMFAGEAARKLWQQAHAQPKEEEVTLLFPEQIIPEPPLLPPPPPKKEIYIRTAQNERAETAPKNAAFIADRNTRASTVKAPFPDGTEPLPTMDGLKLPTRELADRDHRDGELKDDARPQTPKGAALAMLQPQEPTPPTPPSIVKPKNAAPPPQPVTPPQKVAKVVPESTPLTKMMEEADKALAKVDKNRLTIEVKKPEATPDDAPPMPQKPEQQTPPARETAQAMPESQQQPIPKALPVLDEPETRSTTRNQEDSAFTPHTRTTQTKGTISNRGTEASVDAEETPKGRYIRQVTGQVEKKWHLYRLLRRDGVTYGSLEIVFYVNKKGKVEDLRIVNDKESNPVLTGFTLQAIRDAIIPPIPADVIPSLPMNDQERLKIEYNVLIY
ncbi:hypothetical protein [Prosthecobacter sp.]|uniref:hypothetical protein n=1 Tax=Prosthecobacter sp. TaxID=1965333 RepID=UPI001DEECC57|nr:hypothetical protein [Prosthecobacter sp.]MCB1276958.1 hypothetical protein [Prosthecobacter sp.]